MNSKKPDLHILCQCSHLQNHRKKVFMRSQKFTGLKIEFGGDKNKNKSIIQKNSIQKRLLEIFSFDIFVISKKYKNLFIFR